MAIQGVPSSCRSWETPLPDQPFKCPGTVQGQEELAWLQLQASGVARAGRIMASLGKPSQLSALGDSGAEGSMASQKAPSSCMALESLGLWGNMARAAYSIAKD